MEYFSAIKNNEIMPLAANWRELEMIILNEVRQRKKAILLRVTALDEIPFNCSTSTDDFYSQHLDTIHCQKLCKEIPKL